MSTTRIIKDEPSLLVLGPGKSSGVLVFIQRLLGILVLLLALLLSSGRGGALVGRLFVALFGILILAVAQMLADRRKRSIEFDIQREIVRFQGKARADRYVLHFGEIKSIRLHTQKRSSRVSGSGSSSTHPVWICDLLKNDGGIEFVDKGVDETYIHRICALITEKSGLALDDQTDAAKSRIASRTYSRPDSFGSQTGKAQNPRIREEWINDAYRFSWPKRMGLPLILLLLVFDSLFFAAEVFMLSKVIQGDLPVILFIFAGGLLFLFVWAISKGIVISLFGWQVHEVNRVGIRKYIKLFGRVLKKTEIKRDQIRAIRVITDGQGSSRLEVATVEEKTIPLEEISDNQGTVRPGDLHWLEKRYQQILQLEEN